MTESEIDWLSKLNGNYVPLQSHRFKGQYVTFPVLIVLGTELHLAAGLIANLHTMLTSTKELLDIMADE